MEKSARELELENMIFRMGMRITDLLEVCRQWEPDHAAPEHLRLMFFAREAQKDSQALLVGRAYAGCGPVERRMDEARR